VTSALVVDRRGDVVLLTLSREAKRNALDPALCGALAAAVAALGPDGARAAVLTGAGDRAFCAGFDVAALSAAGAVEPDGTSHPFDALIDAVTRSPVPIVCALNGAAIGGGCELAATCDLRVAHPAVELALPPARLGIVYVARGLVRIAALAGDSRAREMFLTARPVAAEEAARWGLVDHVVPAADVLPRALALATGIAALAPLAVQGMRASFEALLRARAALPPQDAARIDALRAAAWRSDDAAEARAAFAERREARFRGR
jgi:enoyl-CoA hydratase/carnithine racemase